MAYDIGAKIGMDGEAEFRKTIQGINDNLRTLGTEMKATASQFDKSDTSINALTSKNTVLNKQIEEQKNKLSELEKGLASSTEKYGENDRITNSWQRSVNQATADLNKMERELQSNKDAIEEANKPTEDLAKEVEDLGESAEESGGKFDKLGGVLKGAAVAMGTIAVAAGAAAVKLGKEVIMSFADYEQFVGGVDTLFKESSGKLQDYAANAYKTAGMSANEYMETSTSFAASLIQSLGGDTEKAVEYADRAITDMSDNANKMGSDISSIQDAYQGFAKQNYTMLDNLKLGYGGTKGEMERLLADATAISGISYDVSSYSDVVDAIHIIQTEMDITGTTAKEATETIAGSFSAMGSATQNWITGLGRADADMKGLTNNLVDAFQDVVKNVTPIIKNLTEALPEAFSAMLPAISDILPGLLDVAMDLFTQVLGMLIGLIPSLIPVAVDAVMTIVKTIIDNLPLIINSAVQLILSLVQGISDSLPELIPAMIEAVLTIAETLLDNVDMLVEAGLELLIGLATGLVDAIPQLIEKIPVIIDGLVNAITSNMPQIIAVGIQLIIALAAGLIKAIPQLISATPQIIGSIVRGLAEGISSITSIGTDLVKGLWQGMSDAIGWIVEKIAGFGSKIVGAFKKVFKIESPSKLFRDDIGKNLALGLGEGFVGEMDEITKDITDSIPTDFEIAGVYGIDGSVAGYTNPVMGLLQEVLNRDINIPINLSMITDGREWANATIPYTQPLITEREMRQNRLRGVIN